MQTQPTAADRVLARAKVHPLGCWEFVGAVNHGGYGIVQLGRGIGTDRAHRVMWRDWFGEIPNGMTVDHLCLNPRCVNPAHLELVTRAENTRRQWAAGRANAGIRNTEKTHCLRGHPFDAKNTYYAGGHRICRACAAARARNYRDKESNP